MTLDQLLDALRPLELQLRSSEAHDFFRRQPEDIRKRFVSLRGEVTFLVGKLTNARLSAIANKLDELSDDLRLGIEYAQGKIESLNDAIEILNALGAVLGLAARVAVLAA